MMIEFRQKATENISPIHTVVQYKNTGAMIFKIKLKPPPTIQHCSYNLMTVYMLLPLFNSNICSKHTTQAVIIFGTIQTVVLS